MSFSVSAIVPTYERGHLIGETIESILGQSVPAREVIVVDDGSTDDTAQVCASFGSRVCYKRIDHCGVQIARNTGAALATSAWLALCDSDDLWLPDHLERISNLINAHPEVRFVCNDFMYIGESIESPWTSTSNAMMAPEGFWEMAKEETGTATWILTDPIEVAAHLFDARGWCPFWPSGTTISKSYYDQLGGYEPRMVGIPSEDFEFTFRCVINEKQIGFIAHPTVRIRTHGGNNRASLRTGRLRQTIGEITVCCFIVRQLSDEAYLSGKALEMISFLSADAMDYAFSVGRLDLVRALSLAARSKHLSFKLVIKDATARMPNLIGKWLNGMLVDARSADSAPLSSQLLTRFKEEYEPIFGDWQGSNVV
jgi:hypothetical protein